MNNLRAVLKLGLFLIATLFIYSLIMLSLIGKLVGLNYDKVRGYLLRTWGKLCCWILGIKLEIRGEPPTPPFLLVSNHLSYVDIFVLFSQLRCLFVAKSDVKTWPLIGFIVKTCGILFIDRQRKRDVPRVNDLISKNINENQGIILFPEGTTSPGYDILPFRTSLLEFPASQNFPVSYAAISYASDERDGYSVYKTVCWWDDAPFLSHFFKLLKMKRFKAIVQFGNESINDKDRKRLAENLHQHIKRAFEPVIEKEDFRAKHDEFKPLSF